MEQSTELSIFAAQQQQLQDAQSMDIDLSESPTNSGVLSDLVNYTCNSNHSNRTKEFVVAAEPTAITAIVSNTSTTVPKKATCPYERPTLKTMEAVNKPHNYPSSSLPVLDVTSKEEDTRNANLIRPSDVIAEDNLNNNNINSVNPDNSNNSASVNLLPISESERNLISEDVNANPSIIPTVDDNKSDRVDLDNKSVIESDQKQNPQKKASRKKQPTSDHKCNCTEAVTLRVKAAESPPPQRISLARSSLNDGILSNCLSALNFVSGNRIGSSDSKSSGSAVRSPRGSKSNKSTASSLGE